MEAMHSMRLVDSERAVEPMVGTEVPFVFTAKDRDEWLRHVISLPGVGKDAPGAVSLGKVADVIRSLAPGTRGSAVINAERKKQILEQIRGAV